MSGQVVWTFGSNTAYIIIQSTQDSRFPGRGRTLGGGRTQGASDDNSDSNLQARLLDDPSDTAPTGTGQHLSDGRYYDK